MAEWCTIESDPGVFEEMVRNVGVRGVQVREVFSLDYDPALYAALEPLYGFIFLFKWALFEADEDAAPLADPQPFFASQVVHNACATQALLSVLLNQGAELDLGPRLRQFKDFCADLDPYSRGLSIGESDFIREVHNSFGVRKGFEVEATRGAEKQDAFHFIAYVPHDGRACELDGLQKAPRGLAPAAAGEGWIEAALRHISRRVAAYEKAEIRFTLLAVVQDPLIALSAQKTELEAEVARLRAAEGGDALGSALQRLHSVEQAIARRGEEMAAQSAENARRKHNYLPLIFSLLEGAARSGRLESLLQEAQQRVSKSAT